MIKPLPDARERQLALDVNRSFICEAPAGSGKTELLTQRYLSLLATVNRPEEILAITFTRKATGEMRERILAALHSASEDMPQEPHKHNTWQLAKKVLQRDQNKAWHLLNNPNRLKISTFDSLCSSLSRHLPLQSGFGALPQLSEDNLELYQLAIRRCLEDLESQHSWAEPLLNILKLLDNRYDRFEAMMLDLLYTREQWLPLIGSHAKKLDLRAVLENGLNNVVLDLMQQLYHAIPQCLRSELISLSEFAAGNLVVEKKFTPISYCRNISTQGLQGNTSDQTLWMGIVEILLNKQGQWRTKFDKSIGFPAGVNTIEKKTCKQWKERLKALIEQLSYIHNLQPALQAVRQLPHVKYTPQQWEIIDSLFKLLPVLAAQLQLVFREKNNIDFTELSLTAQRALGDLYEPSELALKMDYQISHILVDEFQDTSLSQITLLNQLTNGWTPEDGRSLFCVGDAMQSIYSFRGANVGLFLHCKQHGLDNVPLEPLKLKVNFRSRGGVVNWINRTFAKAFPQVNDVSSSAVRYSPSVAFNSDNHPAVTVNAFADCETNLQEAEFIVDMIQQTQKQFPDDTIAILVRSREHITELARLLKQHNLTYQALELEALQSHTIIRDLMSLLHALAHPANRKAWLAILRAPWCGLSLDDLTYVASLPSHEPSQYASILSQCHQALRSPSPTQSNTQAGTPLKLSVDGQKRLHRVLPILQNSVSNRDRKPLRTWFEGTWLALGGPACVQDRAAIESAQVFFQLLENWENFAEIPSLTTLEIRLGKLYAKPDPTASKQLQIMTIHKSKGLEFDWVVVPSLEKKARNNSPGLMMWKLRLNSAGNSDLLIAPNTPHSNQKYHPTYEFLRNQEKQKQHYENCRLLYVACTRARKHLRLCCQVKNNSSQEKAMRPPPANALLSPIWSSVQSEMVYPKITASSMSPSFEENQPSQTLYRLKSDWQAPPIINDNLLQAYIPAHQFSSEANQVVLDWQSPSKRFTGTLIHQLFKQLCDEGLKNTTDQHLVAMCQQSKQLLQLAGIANSDLETSVNKVVRALRGLRSSATAQWIFSAQHPFNKSEYPVTWVDKSATRHLIIDRVFTEAKGTTWIIDYKTSEPEDGEPQRTFIQQETKRYISQLITYKQALQAQGFGNIRCGIYFPLLDHLSEIDKNACA